MRAAGTMSESYRGFQGPGKGPSGLEGSAFPDIMATGVPGARNGLRGMI